MNTNTAADDAMEIIEEAYLNGDVQDNQYLLCLNKGKKAFPIGSYDKSKTHIKTANGWEKVKKEDKPHEEVKVEAKQHEPIQSSGLAVYYKDKILLVHPKGAGWFGTYSIPKGEIGQFETHREAAKRETQEEVGLQISQRLFSEPVLLENKHNDKVVKQLHAHSFTAKTLEQLHLGHLQENEKGYIVLPKDMLQSDEVDWAGFVPLEEAKKRIVKYQLPLVESQNVDSQFAITGKTSKEQENIPYQEREYYHGIRDKRLDEYLKNNAIPNAEQAFGGDFSITDDFNLAKNYAGEHGKVIKITLDKNTDVTQGDPFGTEDVSVGDVVDVGEGEFLVMNQDKLIIAGKKNEQQLIKALHDALQEQEQAKDSLIAFIEEYPEYVDSQIKKSANLIYEPYVNRIKDALQSAKQHYADAIIINSEGKVLMLLRTAKDKKEKLNNKWSLPGGHVDAGETSEEACIREVKEETNLVVENVFERLVKELPDAVITYYSCSVDEDQIAILDAAEHKNFKWVNYLELQMLECIYDVKETLNELIFQVENNKQEAIQKTKDQEKIDSERSLLIVRHGSTKFNGESNQSFDKIRGHIDVPLDKRGIKEAHQTADQLQGKVDIIYCSDLKRAHETAKIIAKTTGATIVKVTPNLRPWNLGDFQGKKTNSVLGEIKYYAEHPDEKVPAGKRNDSQGEPFNSFKNRFLNEIKKITEQNKDNDKKVCVVTHYRGIKLMEAWEAAGMNNDNSIDVDVLIKQSKTDKPASFKNFDVNLDKIEKSKKIEVPDDHEIGMKVKKGGSCCANCEYVSQNHKHCANEMFVKWNKSTDLPEKADEYCCDFWEPAEIKKALDILKLACDQGQITDAQYFEALEKAKESKKVLHHNKKTGKTWMQTTRVGKDEDTSKHSHLINYLDSLAKMNVHEIQKNYFEWQVHQAKQVDLVSTSYIETKHPAIKEHLAKSAVVVKQCFKNAALLCLEVPDCKYVEGYMLFHGIPIEHAWNKIGDEYFDVTQDIALGGKNTPTEYVSTGEFTADEVSKYAIETGVYGGYVLERYKEEHQIKKSEDMPKLGDQKDWHGRTFKLTSSGWTHIDNKKNSQLKVENKKKKSLDDFTDEELERHAEHTSTAELKKVVTEAKHPKLRDVAAKHLANRQQQEKESSMYDLMILEDKDEHSTPVDDTLHFDADIDPDTATLLEKHGVKYLVKSKEVVNK